jgi:hypothetical protein
LLRHLLERFGTPGADNDVETCFGQALGELVTDSRRRTRNDGPGSVGLLQPVFVKSGELHGVYFKMVCSVNQVQISGVIGP